jgi:vacuolar protein sorting-associated protein 52
MWLDRFSVNSTPSGTPPPFSNRPYSPAPRRPASRLSPVPQNVRPGFGPRSSSALSLSLISNDSSTSLPGTARQNGVGVKPVVSQQRPSDVPDPLEVLNGILGRQPGDKPTVVEPSKPKELVGKVDFNGLSLEEYVARGNATNRMMNTEAGVETIQHCRMPCSP